jgi:hypothetical protein
MRAGFWRPIALTLVAVVAACSSSPSDEERRLGEALGEELARAASDGNLIFDASRQEALCWGDAVAVELGVERWRQLGVFAPDYPFPDDMEQTDDDLAGIFEALRECLPDREVIRRMISGSVDSPTDGGAPFFEDSQIDCLADELSSRGVTPLRFVDDLTGDEPEATAAYAACGLES